MIDETKINELVTQALASLGEHCDAVQILLSVQETNATWTSYRGCGNWYARQGMAQNFIEQNIAQEHAKEISTSLKDESN